MQKNESKWQPISINSSSNNYFKLCESQLSGTDILGGSDTSIFKNTQLSNVTIPVPPIVINTNAPLATDFQQISIDRIPNIYCWNSYTGDIKFDKWTYRKEARIRDKWIKIRVRYSGKNLAIIHSIVTLYNVSYS